MNTQTRLITLLCVLLGVFGLGLWQMRSAQSAEAEQLLADQQKDRAVLLGSLLELTGESLKNFAGDYSYWDEMLEFAARPSPDDAWARVNIEASLATFHAHGAWVLHRDGGQFYGTVRELPAAFRDLPISGAELAAQLERVRFAHFYERTEAGLLEFRAAPLQPSADTARTSAPRGWFVVARLWRDEQLRILERVLDSELTLLDQPHVRESHEHAFSGVHLVRALPDRHGQPAAFMHAHYFPAPLAMLLRDNRRDLYLLAGVGVVLLAATTWGVSRWVIGPLRRLEHSLARETIEPLGRMADERSEFGRLAQLVTASFEQRQRLEREIDERRRAEAALRASEEQLRESASLKMRLARDLHDGVIQSIYAAGLSLEGMRASLRSDPAAAERRLDATRESLNRTIGEVRGFIEGLEPENSATTEFPGALRSLVATLQALHPAEIGLRIGAAPPRLSAREEVHALQMVRESVSNAIRHGAARVITVAFQRDAGAPILEIGDNGSGFDPAQTRHRGSGLANLASRAAEIDAQLDIRSGMGQGTTVSIRFSPRST